MLKKKCPNCNNESFSAATSGKWVCPYCGKDISNIQSINIRGEKIDPTKTKARLA